MADQPAKMKLFKTPKLKDMSPDDVKLLVDFVRFATDFLKLDDSIHLRLLHAAPDESMTLGCYSIGEKIISVIVEGRNPLDYFRTIAHEMVHQRQECQGRLKGDIPDTGGEIEDEANAVAGQMMKTFIKNHLNKETKKKLGLGKF